MTEPNQPPTTNAVVILYEVFTGHTPDGREVMVQVFRRQGEDKSMSAQIAFRPFKWSMWEQPIRLDQLHEIDAVIKKDGA